MKDLYDVRGVPIVGTTANPLPENPLNRPDIHMKKAVFAVLGFLFLIFMTYMGVSRGEKILVSEQGNHILSEIMTKGWNVPLICTLIVALIYLSLISKRAIIWSIHVYQHYAPDRVRLACVFEPSCSEYMILAVKKYGSIRGVLKGIQRLKRCHPPNFGKDYP